MNERENKPTKTELFSDQSVDRMFKKIKRRNLIRNVIVSTLVSILVFSGGYIGNSLLTNERGWDAYFPIEFNKRITGPNVYLGNEEFQYGFFGGTLNYQEYKVIENRVIPWGEHTLEYNVFEGQANPLVGTSSSVQVTEHGQSRYYNYSSGEREMLFYHPSISYQSYINDVKLLQQIKEDQYIEMGISFDKGYTLKQINQLLPKRVNTTWYWANGYTKSDLAVLKNTNQPIQANQVYGFHTYPERLEPVMKTTEEDFIHNIEIVSNSKNVHYNEQGKKVLDAVKAHQKEGMIIGAVVTGTKEELAVLEGLPFIKATTLGAIIAKYE